MGNQLTIRGPWLKQAQIQALINDYAAPLSHAARHQDGGADELALTGLVGSHKMSFGSFTRDLTLAAGTQIITGVGFTPKHVIFHSGNNATVQCSWGCNNVTTINAISKSFSGSLFLTMTDFSIHLSAASGVNSKAYISSFDSDGFTLTWSKSGSPTGTADIFYIAFF